MRFVLKYLATIDGDEFEVLRFDSAHEMPHIDILAPDGETKQKVWLSHLTNKSALTYAKEDIEQHYQLYREKFIQWKKEEQQN